MQWAPGQAEGPPVHLEGPWAEPMVRFELTACRLRGGCSATELHRHGHTSSRDDARVGYQSRRPRNQEAARQTTLPPNAHQTAPQHRSTMWTSFSTSSTA